ncbi:hypothetical protein FSP39_006066 [Pinctada imbricata]|uniref:Aminotransferase class I/classII large domain-containing protein n=1 Tax=Pinctada imbricata TaxID=66713 RepID=A0AA88YMF6_PINIB|nr:hypothetical protein FSP39_006066 [Pinctada imbricata]
MLNHYTRGAGHPRLVNILAKVYSKQLQHEIHPMTNVLTSIGAFDALYTTFQALVNPGDEVIIMEPYYEPYKEICRLAGAKVVYVPLAPKEKDSNSDGWVYDFEQLQTAFSLNTKAIIVNNPMNPLGKVFTKDELQPIADLCVKYNVLCVADEVYEYFIYGGRKHYRMATFPGMFERTLTIGSAGKTFNATGWKVGWAIGPENLISPLQEFHHNTIRTNPTPLQEAVAVGFETEFERLDRADCYFTTMSQEMEEKRDQLAGYLREAGLRPIIPSGGCFVIADISSLERGDDTKSPGHSTRMESIGNGYSKWTQQ